MPRHWQPTICRGWRLPAATVNITWRDTSSRLVINCDIHLLGRALSYQWSFYELQSFLTHSKWVVNLWRGKFILKRKCRVSELKLTRLSGEVNTAQRCPEEGFPLWARWNREIPYKLDTPWIGPSSEHMSCRLYSQPMRGGYNIPFSLPTQPPPRPPSPPPINHPPLTIQRNTTPNELLFHAYFKIHSEFVWSTFKIYTWIGFYFLIEQSVHYRGEMNSRRALRSLVYDSKKIFAAICAPIHITLVSRRAITLTRLLFVITAALESRSWRYSITLFCIRAST